MFLLVASFLGLGVDFFLGALCFGVEEELEGAGVGAGLDFAAFSKDFKAWRWSCLVVCMLPMMITTNKYELYVHRWAVN